MREGYLLTTPLKTTRIKRLDLEGLNIFHRRFFPLAGARLAEFKALPDKGPERIFYELCYCILTPQASGFTCDRVIAGLVSTGVLSDPVGRRDELEEALKKTRFWRTKAKNIIRAWERFAHPRDRTVLDEIREKLEDSDGVGLRNWFRKEVKGMGIGMKEASHFLRNIGFYEDIAIVDRHILRCMVELGVVNEEGALVRSEKEYLSLEQTMSEFSSRIEIPVEELDLLMWASRTGYIFK